MRLSDLQIDIEKADKGIWWNYATKSTCPGNKPHATDACFLVLPSLSNRLTNEVMEQRRPHADHLRNPPDEADARGRWEDETREIIHRTRARAAARVALRGWVNLTDNLDQDIKWSEDAATQLLLDRANVVLLDFIELCAFSTEAVLAKEEEAARGN